MSDSPHMSSCKKTNYPVSAMDSFPELENTSNPRSTYTKQ